LTGFKAGAPGTTGDNHSTPELAGPARLKLRTFCAAICFGKTDFSGRFMIYRK
jgi:hypothetical protein